MNLSLRWLELPERTTFSGRIGRISMQGYGSDHEWAHYPLYAARYRLMEGARTGPVKEFLRQWLRRVEDTMHADHVSPAREAYLSAFYNEKLADIASDILQSRKMAQAVKEAKRFFRNSLMRSGPLKGSVDPAHRRVYLAVLRKTLEERSKGRAVSIESTQATLTEFLKKFYEHVELKPPGEPPINVAARVSTMRIKELEDEIDRTETAIFNEERQLFKKGIEEPKGFHAWLDEKIKPHTDSEQEAEGLRNLLFGGPHAWWQFVHACTSSELSEALGMNKRKAAR